MKQTSYIIVLAALFLVACKSGSEKIDPVESSNQENSSSSGIFSNNESQNNPPGGNSGQQAWHQVKVVESLPTEKYTYLKVEESGDEYWLATSRGEYITGSEYRYKDGLLKTNFESKEHNRIFPKLYLVSQLIPLSSNKTNSPQGKINELKPHPEAISIADIVNNPEKYRGKEVIVSGICTKLNANIMGRNWIHIQDGTKDDYDFVISSSTAIPPGHAANFKGVLNTNVDLGAGYTYDILLENAELIK